MSFLLNRSVTRICAACILCLAASLVLVSAGYGQSAESLNNVRRIWVGSLGSYGGAEELRRQLLHDLNKANGFKVVDSPAQADAVLEGKGELWIRGYHSLNPRASRNLSYADPLYDGYLSVKLRGRDDEILWSYFADPPTFSFRELKKDLAHEVISRLEKEKNEGTAPQSPMQTGNEMPAALRGAGATFPLPIYEEWFKSFHARHPVWTWEYSPSGSETGVQQLEKNVLDFAGTDIPPSQLNLLDTRSFPTVGGAVVLIYNLPQFTGNLRLTADLIAGIFSGNIRFWDDPALRAANPQATLPNAPIRLFYRSDGSGTTFALTEFLSMTNAKWKQTAGTSTHLPQSAGEGATGNEGMAQAVASTPYSLGYAELIYAFNHHLRFASVRNQSGRYVAPDLLSIMAAANSAGDKQEYLGLSILNSPEPSAYPVSTVSWLVIPIKLEPAKKAAVTAFLEWMLISGQRQCSALGYAPLPRNLVDRELSAVRSLK